MMNIRKKATFLVWFSIILFLIPITVSADNYGSLKCSAKLDAVTITWTVKANENGDGKGTVTAVAEANDDTISSVAGSYVPTYTVKENWNFKNFINKRTNKLSCPTQVWVKISSSGQSTNIAYTPSFSNPKESGYKEYRVKEIENNNMPAQNEAIDSRTCEYDGIISATSGNSAIEQATLTDIVSITRIANQDSLDISFRNGYQYAEHIFGKLDVELIPLDKNVTCPNLYVVCGGNDKMCTISTTHSNPNFDSAAGDEPDSADSLSTIENHASLVGLNQNISCSQLFSTEEEGSVAWLIQQLLNYIRIFGPVLVVILSAMDFIKAVASSDENTMKKAQSKLIIRLIATVALFLVPTLVELVLKLITGISDSTCFLK